MEYRINRRTNDRISALGFGTSYIAQSPEEEAVKTIRRAYDGGINYYDLATAEARTFSYFGKALSDVRQMSFTRSILARITLPVLMAGPPTSKRSSAASSGS